MTAEAPRAIAYCRQSEARPGEDARTSLSLRSQEDRFRAWCAEHAVVPLAVIADHDLRGADAARPGIRELLDRVEADRVDIVWVLSLSRFARDHILQELIWRDLQARGVSRLVSDIESGTDDPFVRGIYGLIHAKAKTEQSAHLRNAFARRARDGGFPTGPTPMGYRRPHRITIHRANGSSYERETGEPAIDDDAAALVRELYDRVDRGDSLHAIADDLARQGAGPRGGIWTRRTLQRVLQSPIYTGDIVHHGDVVAHDDQWQIVPRDQWDRVQTRLARRVVVHGDTHPHWLAGLVEHGCGQRMYFQPDRRINGGEFGCRTAWELPATRCQVDRRHIGAAMLERIVRHLLARDLAGRRSPDGAAAHVAHIAGGLPAKRARMAVERRWRDAEARWARAYERFAAGKLASALMDAEDATLATARAEHAAQLATLPTAPDRASIERASAVVDTLAVAISDATDDELHAILDALGRVVVDGHGVAIHYHADLAPLFDSAPVAVPRYGKGWRG